ncbi:prepilin-type N-terminal cleavage/methylation domain-containing protein [Sulfurimicrobium lacus]|uniref:Prepilin-type N-terminal cleavage/methylation domain-containing protein n=1 Tax=Sulfurimicrobium lacus TaxID=2715678 RepID=A0A6F8VI63_9PROT|nr:prepilin-type N-terminal cleavage/methylation domain-containing protein [Sulfurimicrobium lacus]BCB28399.1 prepilin-type N-terminal cleavage/methylation domain-containing protein [Sulfurimicrobium lacus]
MKSASAGFTLIEMAIVMVIVGLLLSAVLKGNELITNARVRNVIAQQAEIRTAFYGFQDRYRALPGDYPGTSADHNIPDVPAAIGGNGDGKLLNADSNEQTIAWEHLSHAGFLNASYSMSSPTEALSETNTPRNIYNAYLQLAQNSNFANAAGSTPLNVKTGNAIPPDVLAEIDRKIDDGNADRGTFRFSSFSASGTAPSDSQCFSAAGSWNIASGSVNCGAAVIL